MNATGKKPIPFRVGEWLPSDHAVLETWMDTLIRETDLEKKPLHPVIEDLKRLIENDAEIYMLFNQMFEQVPKKPPYNKDPTGKPQVRDYRHMLQLVNAIMTKAPVYNQTGLVGFPINAILDWSMGTIGGYAAFLNDKVNAQLKKVLNEWGRFLKRWFFLGWGDGSQCWYVFKGLHDQNKDVEVQRRARRKSRRFCARRGAWDSATRS